MLTIGRLTTQPTFMSCVYLSIALIVATASDLLLWSKGKHILVLCEIVCSCYVFKYFRVGEDFVLAYLFSSHSDSF